MNSEYFDRVLDLKLPAGQSAFLWGPRKTGKTTYLERRFSRSRRYDLLKSDLLFTFTKEPSRLREEILGLDEETLHHPIIIDEVQKVPALLDEVQWLIDRKRISFILCGSSARKLKRGAANLLGGRAWRYHLFPLTFREVPGLDLLRALNTGLIPSHYLSQDPHKSLKAYIFDYLKEEIRDEGLTRNIPAFSKFLDSLAFSCGQLINYSNIARDCGVDSKTVREYYQILEDTLVGYLIYPYAKRAGRDIISAAPKFYCFDVGMPVALSGNSLGSLRGEFAGNLFENYLLMELMAYRGYADLDFSISFWRTKTHLEVDFILGKAIALEIKIADRIDRTDLRGLEAFIEEHPSYSPMVACLEPRIRSVPLGPGKYAQILPWKEFLGRLWSGKIIGGKTV